jgi:hypothetical protein
MAGCAGEEQHAVGDILRLTALSIGIAALAGSFGVDRLVDFDGRRSATKFPAWVLSLVPDCGSVATTMPGHQWWR